jgi:hypothetical protein
LAHTTPPQKGRPSRKSKSLVYRIVKNKSQEFSPNIGYSPNGIWVKSLSLESSVRSDLIIDFKRNRGILEIGLSEFQIVNFKDATPNPFRIGI